MVYGRMNGSIEICFVFGSQHEYLTPRNNCQCNISAFDFQGTQIELSIGVTFGLSTMAGKVDCDLKHSNVAAAPSMDIG